MECNVAYLLKNLEGRKSYDLRKYIMQIRRFITQNMFIIPSRLISFSQNRHVGHLLIREYARFLPY